MNEPEKEVSKEKPVPLWKQITTALKEVVETVNLFLQFYNLVKNKKSE